VNQKVKNNLQWGIMLLGMLTPVLIILIFPTTYYQDDLGDFWNWSQFLKENVRDIYIQCTSCNYPLFGTLVTGGVLSRMGFDNFSEMIIPFRLYLAMFDAANVFLIYKILKKLEIQSAPLWAGIIGLLPSSWMGSSVWGQIEGISQFLILLTCLLIISFNLKAISTKFPYTIYLILVGGLLSLMLLTKQLILFSLVSVTFFAVLRSLAILSLAFLSPIFVIDLFLIDHKGYFSHLGYIFTQGSKHGDIISGNGFNLWTFFVASPTQPSRLPIEIQIAGLPSIAINPYSTGIILFLLINLILAFLYLRYFYKNRFTQAEQFFNLENIFLLFLHIGLVNLSFNLFLTGTHERYLYHFYPFVIIAALGLFNRKLVYFLLAAGTSYALFVLAHIKGLLSLYGQTPFIIMFGIHAPLFIYLIALLWQGINQPQHDPA
jgi:hypothetical protein